MQELCGKTQNQWTVRKSCPSRRYILLARNRLLTYLHLKCRTANMKYFEKTLDKQSDKHKGKISAQPYTTLCNQFLDRENNDKNNTLPLGKQISFTIV